MAENDPLLFPGVRFENDSRVKVEALVPASVLEALRAIRTVRTISPENTSKLLGDLVVEALGRIPGSGVELKGPKESPSVGIVRRALASFLVKTLDTQTVSVLVESSGLSQPTVAVALKTLIRVGMVERIQTLAAGRPVWGYKLTTAGILATAKDPATPQADQFTLGGMLPEGLDPFVQDRIPESVLAAYTPEPEEIEPTPAPQAQTPDTFWKQALERVAAGMDREKASKHGVDL